MHCDCTPAARGILTSLRVQITCGRCDCCSSVKQILEKEGLTEFLWAAEYAGGNLWSFFQEPGWQVTVLAPENEVMKQGLSNWGALLIYTLYLAIPDGNSNVPHQQHVALCVVECRPAATLDSLGTLSARPSAGIDRSSASKHAAALTAIVQTHIIPRKADIKAVYTTPFLTTGVKLQPMLEEQYASLPGTII